MTDISTTLNRVFWRWFSFAVVTLILAAAVPAFSSDVFIDEGDGDFDSTAASAPAKTEKTVAAEPTTAPIDADILNDFPTDNAVATTDAPAAKPDASAPAEVSKPAAKKAKAKAKPAKVSKVEKKAKAKAKPVAAVKKAKAKKVAAKASSKKAASKKVAKHMGKSKRKVASAGGGKFAGGQYATTTRGCSMESAPGAKDSIGNSNAGRKLWVEDAGDSGYWKVYNKAGQAAYLSRDCF